MLRATRIVGLITLANLLSLFPAQPILAQDRLQIYTVNYPLAYFAERIAGDLAEVGFPAPPDVDPAFWMPDSDTIAAYQSADLILLNGANYAKWRDKVSLPSSRLVDTSRRFKDAYVPEAASVNHSHGPGGEHAHGGVAFTTWLDLSQAAQQAEASAEALIRKRPTAKGRIERNLKVLRGELLALDERIAEITGSNPDSPLLASHPVYQYLAKRYGLNLISLTWEPDEVPSDRQWSQLQGMLRDHPARWMLWESEPAEVSVERLRALGVESVVLNPCANRPQTGDFLSVMSDNTRNLEQVFQ